MAEIPQREKKSPQLQIHLFMSLSSSSLFYRTQYSEPALCLQAHFKNLLSNVSHHLLNKDWYMLYNLPLAQVEFCISNKNCLFCLYISSVKYWTVFRPLYQCKLISETEFALQ